MAPLLAALLLAAGPVLQASFGVDANYGYDPTADKQVASSALSGRIGGSTQIEGVLLTLGYAPRLTMTNDSPDRKASFAFFNSGTAAVEMTRGTTLLRLSEVASLGQQDFSVLANPLRTDPQAPAPPPADRLPSQRFIPTFSLGTTALMRQAFSRQLTGAVSANFTSGGGLGHDGRGLLPLDRSAGGDLRVGWTVSAKDELSASATASVNTADNGGKSATGSLQAAWTSTLSPTTTGFVSFGAGFVDNLSLAAVGDLAVVSSTGVQWVPTLHMGLTRVVPSSFGPLSLRADASAQPAADPLSGAGYLRGAAQLGCGWAASPSLSLSAAAIGDRVLSGDLRGAWGGAGELSAAVRANRTLSWRIAFRAALLTPTHVLLPAESLLYQWNVVAGLAGDL